MMAHNIKTEIPDEVPGHVIGQEQQVPMQGMPPQGQAMPQQSQQYLNINNRHLKVNHSINNQCLNTNKLHIRVNFE